MFFITEDLNIQTKNISEIFLLVMVKKSLCNSLVIDCKDTVNFFKKNMYPFNWFIYISWRQLWKEFCLIVGLSVFCEESVIVSYHILCEKL